MHIKNGIELLEHCMNGQCSISKAVIDFEIFNSLKSYDEVFGKMKADFEVMKTAAKKAYIQSEEIHCKIIKNDAKKLWDNFSAGRTLLSPMMTKAIIYALSITEVNASMGKIVTAPTAGSCGVIPGVLISLMEEHNINEDTIINGLFTAAGIGLLIAQKTSLAGAIAGCQAEIGSASAMAAAAVTEIMGGTPEMCLHAAAMTLKSMMGLVCDPVASLVEAPCSKRNASGAMIAFGCAEMALAGVESVIPFDEVADAMAEVGKSIPFSLRETSLGGIAACPTAVKIQRDLFGF